MGFHWQPPKNMNNLKKVNNHDRRRADGDFLLLWAEFVNRHSIMVLMAGREAGVHRDGTVNWPDGSIY